MVNLRPALTGREENHPEGSYYIEWWNGSKRLRRSVGKNAFGKIDGLVH